MQKVFRRTVLAEKQAARRLAKKKEKYIAGERKTARENQSYIRKDWTNDVKTARANLREDYALGPLAPRRDVGKNRETYGTINSMRLQGKELSMAERIKLNPDGGQHATIVTGDRVVLLEGPDKGKIGKITKVDNNRQECTVEGLNMVDVAVPKWMQDAENDSRPTRSMEAAVSLLKIRLVVPMPDPTTGMLRDVIVKRVVTSPIFHDRQGGRKLYSRYIPGLPARIVIPWPKVEPPVYQDHDCDTLRMEVETKTFIPSLLKPPMPTSVIDELRNKYGVFRTRHDEAYIAKKEQEEATKANKKKMTAEMRTPMKQINRLRRKMRKAKGKPRLSKEMLERIGEVIARKQAVLEAQIEARRALLSNR